MDVQSAISISLRHHGLITMSALVRQQLHRIMLPACVTARVAGKGGGSEAGGGDGGGEGVSGDGR